MKTSTLGVLACVVWLNVSLASAQGAWPSTAVWPSTSSSDTYAAKDVSRNPIRDINGDQSPTATDVSSHGASSATGDWNTAYFYADGANLFFRELLNDDPRQAGGYKQFAWLVEIDANGDNATDWYVGVDGVGEFVEAVCSTTGATNASYATSTHARAVSTSTTGPSSGTTMYYLDWQVPFAALSDGAGGCPDVTGTTVLRMFFGTSAAWGQINKDYFTGASVSYLNMGYATPTKPGGTTSTGSVIR